MKNNFPLICVKEGQQVILTKINAGRRLTHRLTELGLTPGVKFSVMQDNGGPIMISVRGSRIAIGREMAKKILVNTLEDQDIFQEPDQNLVLN